MNLGLIYNIVLKGLIYNIVLKGLIGNDINSISNELRISIYEFKTIIGTIRLKSLL